MASHALPMVQNYKYKYKTFYFKLSITLYTGYGYIVSWAIYLVGTYTIPRVFWPLLYLLFSLYSLPYNITIIL